MRNAFTILLAISAAVLLPSTAAHAMPVPRTGVLVPPLVLGTLDSQIILAYRPIGALGAMPKKSAQSSIPVPGIVPPISLSDTGTRKMAGWIFGGISIAGLGASIAYLAANKHTSLGDDAIGQSIVITEIAFFLGIAGVGLLSGAYGDEMAFDAVGPDGDMQRLVEMSWNKSAKIAGAVFGASLMALAIGYAVGTNACTQGSDCAVAVGLSSVYSAQLGLASGLIALFDLVHASLDDGNGSASSFGPHQKIGLTLFPTNGGLGAGIGMRF